MRIEACRPTENIGTNRDAGSGTDKLIRARVRTDSANAWIFFWEKVGVGWVGSARGEVGRVTTTEEMSRSIVEGKKWGGGEQLCITIAGWAKHPVLEGLTRKAMGSRWGGWGEVLGWASASRRHPLSQRRSWECNCGWSADCYCVPPRST